MSDKAEKKAEAPAEGAADGKKAKKGGLLTKLPVLLGGVMVLEAVVLIAGFKFLGGGAPKAASAGTESAEHGEGAEAGGGEGHGEEKSDGHGGGGGHAKKGDAKKLAEIQVVDFRALNKARGQAVLFDVTIFVVVKGDNEEKVKKVIEGRAALIKDRIRTIIAQSDPEKLGGGSEPGLETLRRQVRHQLDEFLPEGMVEEVLVTKCVPFRADF